MSGLCGYLLHFYKGSVWNTYTHKLVWLSGGLWKPWLTRIFTLTEIGLVNNDVSFKSIAGPFLLRSKTIKARKWTIKKIFIVQLSNYHGWKRRSQEIGWRNWHYQRPRSIGIDIIWDLGHWLKFYPHLWSRPFIQHHINKQTICRQCMNIVHLDECTLLRVF